MIRRAFKPRGGAAAGQASLSPLDATIISIRPTGMHRISSAMARPPKAAIAIPR
ncbi:hypothetical protein [Sphingobium sp. HWE2-09]|uniref:hypothetical protein n=1 Tax=Sphingobium sp. HWE2-09 TaxID=3108390 RepID=UPI00403E457B